MQVSEPDDDVPEPEGPKLERPVERLPAWWGPIASDSDQVQLAASEFDTYEFADRIGFDDEALQRLANTSTTRHRYMLCECLSDTRWAWVYVALDITADRPVVLKISTREVEPEGRTITRLNHPNVVTVHDMFVFAGYPTLVLEWCTQGSLSSYAHGADDWRDVLARGLEAGRGLVYCHAQNVIHGDLKPTNILVTRHVGKLADFGISRGETKSGQFGGTLGYAPPERERGVWTAAGDVYSFAMTLESSLRIFEGVPDSVHALLTMATVEDPEERPALEVLLANLEHEIAVYPIEGPLGQRPPDGERERRGIKQVRRTLERRRRQVFLQTAVMAMFVLVTLGSAGLAAKCMVAPLVEPREPSIERAIELAEADDPLGAMVEYHELDQRKARGLSPADHLRLAESLFESTSRLPSADASAAASLAELAATRALMTAEQRGDAATVERAKRIQLAARAVNHHN